MSKEEDDENGPITEDDIKIDSEKLAELNKNNNNNNDNKINNIKINKKNNDKNKLLLFNNIYK